MQTVLIVFHLMIVIALVASVLLQRSEGGALGVGGGGFMTGRGQASALTRATAILAALFFVTSLALSILASYGRAPKSILDTAAPASHTAPVPGGSPLDQLRKMEEQRSTTAPATGGAVTPAVPAAPTSPEPPKSE